MERKYSQLPLITSTPRPWRSIVNLPDTFNEVSPIMPIPIRKTKSLISVKPGTMSRPKPMKRPKSSMIPVLVDSAQHFEHIVNKFKEEMKNVVQSEDPPISLELQKSSKLSVGTAHTAVRNVLKSHRKSRISRILQRPSVLSSIPEASPSPGSKSIGEHKKENIFKDPEHSNSTQVAWQMPLQNKTLSLKRKSRLPQTVDENVCSESLKTAGTKECLFDENIKDLSPLDVYYSHGKRKTYTLKSQSSAEGLNCKLSNGITDCLVKTQSDSYNDILIIKQNINVEASMKKQKIKTIAENGNVKKSGAKNSIISTAQDIEESIFLPKNTDSPNKTKYICGKVVIEKSPLNTSDILEEPMPKKKKHIVKDKQENKRKPLKKATTESAKDPQKVPKSQENNENICKPNVSGVSKLSSENKNFANNILSIENYKLPMSNVVNFKTSQTMTEQSLAKNSNINFKGEIDQQLSQEGKIQGRKKKITTLESLEETNISQSNTTKIHNTRLRKINNNKTTVKDTSRKEPKESIDIEPLASKGKIQKKTQNKQPVAKSTNNEHPLELKTNKKTKSRKISKLKSKNISDEEIRKVTNTDKLIQNKQTPITDTNILKTRSKPNDLQENLSEMPGLESLQNENISKTNIFIKNTMKNTDNNVAQETETKYNTLNEVNVEICLTDKEVEKPKKSIKKVKATNAFSENDRLGVDNNCPKDEEVPVVRKSVVKRQTFNHSENLQANAQQSVPDQSNGIKMLNNQISLNIAKSICKKNDATVVPDIYTKEDEFIKKTAKQCISKASSTAEHDTQVIQASYKIGKNSRTYVERKNKDKESNEQIKGGNIEKGVNQANKSVDLSEDTNSSLPSKIKRKCTSETSHTITSENHCVPRKKRLPIKYWENHKEDDLNTTRDDRKNVETSRKKSKKSQKREIVVEEHNQDLIDVETSRKKSKRSQKRESVIEEHNQDPIDVHECFGLNSPKCLPLRPDVSMQVHVHINNYVMTGSLIMEAGASITKASTNTIYFVTEGAATVTLSKVTKIIHALDPNNSFFIPKRSDFLITNGGSAALKMYFSKFKG